MDKKYVDEQVAKIRQHIIDEHVPEFVSKMRKVGEMYIKSGKAYIKMADLIEKAPGPEAIGMMFVISEMQIKEGS